MLAQALLRFANTGDRYDNVVFACACYELQHTAIPFEGLESFGIAHASESPCLLKTSH